MEPKYDPPYPLSKLPKHLINDPVHRWRAITGIELIHEEPTYEEYQRISNNWNLMPDDMKVKSSKLPAPQRFIKSRVTSIASTTYILQQ